MLSCCFFFQYKYEETNGSDGKGHRNKNKKNTDEDNDDAAENEKTFRIAIISTFSVIGVLIVAGLMYCWVCETYF